MERTARGAGSTGHKTCPRVSVFEHFRRIYEPGLGKLEDVREVSASHDGRYVALAGSVYEQLGGVAASRIGVFDTAACALSLLESGGNDIGPRWSPSGQLAFLSDRGSPGRFRLYVADTNGMIRPEASEVPGSAESLSWSPDGARILLRTAVTASRNEHPEWFPKTEPPNACTQWRRIFAYVVADGCVQAIHPHALTFWEAVWCGNDAVAAIVSDDPREGAWHETRLVHLPLSADACRTIYRPEYELGLPAATPDGAFVAVVEACCSDRGLVAGDVQLFERGRAWQRRAVDTHGVDVTFLQAAGNGEFDFAGLCDFEVAAGVIHTSSARARIARRARETWLRTYPATARAGKGYVTVAHSYANAPSLVYFDGAEPAVSLHGFAHAGSAYVAETTADLKEISWKARDGLSIHGYLARPSADGPFPLVVLVHGGPVSAHTNSWALSQQLTGLLVSRGYAVLLPNPRGSAGRGQAFAQMVRGDVGGEETYDILCGIEFLIGQGIAQAGRLAVMGGSHGGFMAAWLVTQTNMFAAAVSAFPITDWFSMRFESDNALGDALFLGGDPFDSNGPFVSRSPIRYAGSVRTPTLSIAGALDTNCDPAQARSFHRALVLNGAVCELVIYPQEGHGIRRFEAYVDYCSRILAWFEKYVPAATPDRPPAPPSETPLRTP